jgi:uncharacterized phage protein (TIGR01671 family)
MAVGEIKFRGYSEEYKAWFYGGFVKSNGQCFIIDKESVFFFYNKEIKSSLFPKLFYKVEPKSVGQFIGSTDANNKPIYEGDIVKQLRTKKINIVSYNHDWTGYEPFFSGYENYKAYEVIGNIFESYDLLKK